MRVARDYWRPSWDGTHPDPEGAYQVIVEFEGDHYSVARGEQEYAEQVGAAWMQSHPGQVTILNIVDEEAA